MAVTPDSPITELKLSKNLTDLLTRTNYDTVGKLIAKPRSALAARMVMTQDLGQLDAALQKHSLWYASETGQWKTCNGCPTCPTCGNPRATSRRNVVVDLRGRASHVGGRPNPTCADCDTHHRSLFEAAAA